MVRYRLHHIELTLLSAPGPGWSLSAGRTGPIPVWRTWLHGLSLTPNPYPEGTIDDIRSYGYEPFVYAHNAGLLPYQEHRDDRYNYFFIPRN
jgi:hypothetical protein